MEILKNLPVLEKKEKIGEVKRKSRKYFKKKKRKYFRVEHDQVTIEDLKETVTNCT